MFSFLSVMKVLTDIMQVADDLGLWQMTSVSSFCYLPYM